ncbi:MAG: amidohydrolase family protein, partial [Flavobacteriaceae bacterium]
ENSSQEDEIELTVTEGDVEWESSLKYENGKINLSLSSPEGLSAILEANIEQSSRIAGTGIDLQGNPVQWEANQETEDNKERFLVFEPVATTFPNSGFGFKTPPQQQRLLFKNATVWTNEVEGILTNADVLIGNGKILNVGKNLSDASATVIDATGKHLTSGIIDEHSHIAASSINEGGHNSSAEVTIEDVVDPDDIDIYRNLAGGVTTIQILHGSANPIGGRSAIIKLKWGTSVEKMLFPNADPFIKFALGENVKQSNWGSYNRFPQTRMGVEQVFVDYFQRAKEYGKAWTQYSQLTGRQKRSAQKPRYDIEMETLWEILEGKRFISCHSYVQSEINMLMKVAERFGVRVNTFTHILEGYKVADIMATHGAAGSTFSDWWAYKYEVKDAIAYNGAIMHRAGVNVAFNSDDAEMSRRLNQEAAKAVKYGGISEEDAWKFVTLNPAKMLHLDDRIGSIKIGKHADLALWSGHPMSVYSKAEKTLIDGVIYYDAERANAQLDVIAEEKKILIAQMAQAVNNGMTTQAPINSEKREFHCETLD